MAWLPGGAAASSTRSLKVTGLSTRPKLGEATTTRRRSASSGRPVSRRWTGAWKPSASRSVGTSWIWPSLMMTAPAMRLAGRSAMPRASAPNRRVPPPSLASLAGSLPAWTTRSSRPGISLIRFCSSASAQAVCGLARRHGLAFGIVDHHDRHIVQIFAVFLHHRRDWRAHPAAPPAPAGATARRGRAARRRTRAGSAPTSAAAARISARAAAGRIAG